MYIHGFHHLAIQVRQLEPMAAFYKQALGLEEQVRHRRADGSLRSIWLAFGPPEARAGFLALEELVEGQPGGMANLGFSVLALAIDPAERAAAIERLTRLGAPIVHQSRWSVFFEDPEGNRLALSHYPADPLPG